MAEEESKPSKDAAPAEEAKPSRLARLKQAVVRRWLPLVIVGSVITHGILLAMRSSDDGVVDPRGEVTLGDFMFEKNLGSHGHIASARFNLHISLLRDKEAKARKLLKDRQYKVQQDIEELLRQSHGGDFDDPQLSELKRQLQEQINVSLETRAIADVIITDLEIEHDPTAYNVEQGREYSISTGAGSGSAGESMGPAPAPWEEKPGG